ncbi:MAG: peptide chain release factor N(5)-glutamine methyltransferase [Terracidiphilus sp.]|jgi:release factor glutamine methyltransferase
MPSMRHHFDLGELALKDGPHPEIARRDAGVLLTHTLKRSYSWLLAHGDELLSDELSLSYTELLARRRRGEPIQYITGETEFYGLPFCVTPDVLIPRPETEHLADKVIELAARFEQPRIVDVGTGSGAIAVALAHKLPHAQITATDISSRALAVAGKNAKRNGVDLRFLTGDLLAPVAGERFEIVVSNPPYVPSGDRATLSVEVREYEPGLALFAGDDGLDVYRRLIPAAFNALTTGGFVALEIGYGQSQAITELLVDAGFAQIEFVPDLQNIPRVACAQRP